MLGNWHLFSRLKLKSESICRGWLATDSPREFTATWAPIHHRKDLPISTTQHQQWLSGVLAITSRRRRSIGPGNSWQRHWFGWQRRLIQLIRSLCVKQWRKLYIKKFHRWEWNKWEEGGREEAGKTATLRSPESSTIADACRSMGLTPSASMQATLVVMKSFLATDHRKIGAGLQDQGRVISAFGLKDFRSVLCQCCWGSDYQRTWKPKSFGCGTCQRAVCCLLGRRTCSWRK